MEGGFGSGLRAKLAGQEEEPRSPAEAIAAADPASPDVELLRAELSASLAREQDLRASLHEKLIKAVEESEQKARKAEDESRKLEQLLGEREERLTKAEQEATQARVQLEARGKVLEKREAEIAAESGKREERLVVKAREL